MTLATVAVDGVDFCDVRCQMLRAENHLRSADVELQQRAVEYLQLSNVASIDVMVSLCVCVCVCFFICDGTLIWVFYDNINALTYFATLECFFDIVVCLGLQPSCENLV